MSQFEQVPIPSAKPSIGGFDFSDTWVGGALDDLFNFATGAFDSYVKYDQYEFQKNLYEEQAQVNNYAGQPQATAGFSSFGSVDYNQVITLALIAGGVVLLAKAVK